MPQGGLSQGGVGQGNFGEEDFGQEGSGLGGKSEGEKKSFPYFLITGELDHCLKANVRTKCGSGAGPIVVNHSE